MPGTPPVHAKNHLNVAEELKLKDFAIASSIYAIGIADLYGKITYVNNASMEMYGTNDPNELIGQNILDFARSREEAVSILESVLNTGRWEGEVGGFRKDGTSIITLLSANLVYNNEGKPVCIMTSLIDITGRKKMEEDLRLKDFAIASSIYAIGIADLNARITYVNKAAIELWGAQSEAELLGKNALDIAVSDAQAREVLSAILENGKWEGEIVGIRKDGMPVTTILSANLVYNDENEPVCIMASLLDITDRKKMEEELKLKDFAIASSIYAIGIADLNARITYVNKAAIELWGAQSEAELLGKNALDIAMSDDQAREVLSAILENGKWEGEIVGIRKDGMPVTTILSANLVYNDESEPVCIMASLLDITDRKQIEEELKLKDFAIASSIYAIGIADLNARITYVNKAAIELWGAQSEAELLGKNALDIAMSDDEAREVLSAILENGKWEGEIIGIRKDGMPVTTILSANLVYNDENEPVCIMASLLDITDRKKMEQELRIKDFAVSSSINAMVIGDLNGNITYVNDSFLYLWGDDTPDEVIGKPAVSFARDQSLAETVLAGILDKGEWSGEIEGIRKDGKILTVQLSANLVTNGHGEPFCLMASFVDITDRKMAERKLAQANRDLENRVAERTRDLVRANELLMAEIEERKEIEMSLRAKENELKVKTENLQETNTALKILLRQREEDRKEMEEKVLANVNGLVLPYVEKLKNICKNKTQATYIDIMETNVREIISPYLKKLSAHYSNFTPLQIQVADLVKAGKSTKEISEVLNISDRAVEFHRNNIRSKLGIKNRKVNLQTYLLSLS